MSPGPSFPLPHHFPLIVHSPPQSTLQAVAHRRGGGCHSAQCCHLALLVVVVPFSIVIIIWPWSTSDPPNEQQLVGMAAGAPSSPVGCCQVLVLVRSVALALPVVVPVSWVWVIISRFVVVTSIFHLSSTP